MVTSMSPAFTTINTMASPSRSGGRLTAPSTKTVVQVPRARLRIRAVPNRSQSPPPTTLAAALPIRLTERRSPNPPTDSPSERSMSMAATAQAPQNSPKSTKTTPTGRKLMGPF